MLIGLHFNKGDSKEYKKELGVDIAKAVGGRTRVFEAKDVDEYVDTLKTYSPAKRENLVLINTHLDFDNSMSTGMWRASDIAFNQRGGVIFGAPPNAPSSVYKHRVVTENLNFMVDSASYYSERARTFKKEVKNYVGRVDSDPHTLVLGFSPSWPKLSVPADALYSGLPEGSEESWWWGVGFFNVRNKTSKTPSESYVEILERFYFASRIAVSDTAEEIMSILDEPYQRAEEVRFRSIPEGEKFGRQLRSLSRLDSERVVV